MFLPFNFNVTLALSHKAEYTKIAIDLESQIWLLEIIYFQKFNSSL